jgi:hypothetical protein
MAGARVRDELASELQRRSLRRVHDARATFGGARTAP